MVGRLYDESSTLSEFSKFGTLDTPRIVALTGFMGAGKSTVGRALASLLSWEFLDLDEEIERRENQPIRHLFRLYGEAHFRQIESVTLRDLLAKPSAPTVVALGGGTFIAAENAEQLRSAGARVAFLETPIKDLLNRCQQSSDGAEENLRPLASDREAFVALYHQRLPRYRLADLVVDTSGKVAAEIAQEIASALRLATAAH
jgi:shikimate kinase